MALWNAFKPYQPTVWLLLFLTLCLQCGCASLVAKAEARFNFERKFMPFYVSFLIGDFYSSLDIVL